MNRRHALKLIAASPLIAAPVRLFAAGGSNTKLLIVFMRGGYDAANLLVPTGSTFYYEARPRIAIAKPGSAANAAIALDADWGLHPALRHSLLPLYQKGQLAFVPFAGSTDLSRSHFETQDNIERGQALEGARDYQSGFLNRLAVVLSARSIAFTELPPIIMRGTLPVPNIALGKARKSAVDDVHAAVIADMYKDTHFAGSVSEGFDVRDSVMRDIAREMEASSRNAISASGFETEARRIARLMRDRYNIAFVDVGGWDTHVMQGGAEGNLAGRLERLGRGIAGFAEEMGPAWSDTVVVVVSEFGRTFRENGNGGTDHGHGSVYWVAGGRVRGGRVAGDQVPVGQATLHQDRDYPVLNEYRAVLGGLFARMYGLNGAQVERVFPAAQPKDLALL